jgi:hypothetical protein
MFNFWSNGLRIGDCLKLKWGNIVAKEIYNKDNGDTIDRRISVISNILTAADLCVSKPRALQLRS